MEAKAKQLWDASPAGQAAFAAESERLREQRAEERERREAARAAEARQLWEESIAGQAVLAFHRGDQYFSVELLVNGDLAQHLNDVAGAGWRQQSVGRRHEHVKRSRPLSDGTHESMRETVEYRTYLFLRVP